MSVSINVLSSVRITLSDFADFVIKQGGFISYDKGVNGGFNRNDASVWFYDLTLNSTEDDDSYLSEIKDYLPAPPMCYIYFELSSNKNSYTLMLQIAYEMSKVWPIFLDCCMKELFTYENIRQKILFQKKMILGNSFTFFFSGDKESEISYFIDENFPKRLQIALEDKEELLIDKEDVLRIISITNLKIYFSVVYEYEDQELEVVNLLKKHLDYEPYYFCEILFGYGLASSQEKSLLDLVARFQEYTKSVGMGIFRKILQRQNIEEMMAEGRVIFA